MEDEHDAGNMKRSDQLTFWTLVCTLVTGTSVRGLEVTCKTFVHAVPREPRLVVLDQFVMDDICALIL